tara:strand:+ start:29067 stop:30995 length:1929 start_codon:yes stop_codon:yes gene_type:complete
MTDKVPIRTVFDSSGNATGLAEFQSGETVGHVHGGTGLSSLGSAGQVLKVNAAGNAIEFGSGFSTASGDITLDSAADIVLDADGADIILKDAGTEFGRFTNSGGQLVIKSSSSTTTAMTMSGANVTIAGNLTVTGTTEGDGNITLGDAAGDTVTFGGTIQGSLVFEGSSADSFETTLTPGNPSSDITITLPASASDTLVGLASTQTLTNKTLTTPIITEIDGSTITLDSAGDITLDADGADIILKDAGTEFGRFTNNSGELQIKSGSSATTNLTMSGANTTIAGNLTVTGDATANGSTITLGDSASDTVAFGGTITGNLVFEGSTDDSFETTLTPGNPSADITLTLPSSGSDTLVGKATTDTLTNKTLTSPALTTPAITGNTTTTGNVIFEGSTADSFETTLTVVDPTADRTISLPNATDTLVGKDTTDTLTNKTLTNPVITNITGSSITLDSAGDVNIDADGADVILKDGGTEYGRFTNNSGELQIKSGSSSTTNMTMSGANTTVAGNLTVTGTTTFNGGTITLGDAATDTVAFNGTISTNLIFEGSSADSFETTLAPGNPSADITLTLPTSTGTIATTTDVFFDNSTTTIHPAASGNADLAGGESPFESITDAFGVITGTSYDMMNPKGSSVTVDLGSVA